MEHIVNCDQDMIDVFINSKIEFFREKKCRFIQLESDIDQNHIMYQYFILNTQSRVFVVIWLYLTENIFIYFIVFNVNISSRRYIIFVREIKANLHLERVIYMRLKN